MLQPLLRIADGDAVAFRAGVILDQDRSPPFDHLCLDVDRAGRGGVDRAFQRGDVVARAHLVRQLQHAHEHGRHQLRLRDLVLLDELEEILGVKMLHDDRGAAEHDRHHVEAQRSRVIERRRRQIDALRDSCRTCRAEHAQERDSARRSLAFELPLDALGPAGGAGRIQHVVAGDLVRDRRRRLRGALPCRTSGSPAGARRSCRTSARRRWPTRALICSAHFGVVMTTLAPQSLDDVVDLVLRQIAADRGVIEPARCAAQQISMNARRFSINSAM